MRKIIVIALLSIICQEGTAQQYQYAPFWSSYNECVKYAQENGFTENVVEKILTTNDDYERTFIYIAEKPDKSMSIEICKVCSYYMIDDTVLEDMKNGKYNLIGSGHILFVAKNAKAFKKLPRNKKFYPVEGSYRNGYYIGQKDNLYCLSFTSAEFNQIAGLKAKRHDDDLHFIPLGTAINGRFYDFGGIFW